MFHPYNDESILEEKDPRQIYRFLETEGSGGFGVVTQAREVKTKRPVAIKRFHTASSRQKRHAIREANILKRVTHRNVVEFYGAYQWQGETWLAMEFMQAGSLGQLLKLNKGPLAVPILAYMARELIRGLGFLHSVGIVHRDIKPENIVMQSSGDVKLADFGLATDVSLCELVERAGTSRYMAPEVLMHKSYRYECDTWGLGCTLLHAATGKLPFHECANIFELSYRLCTGHGPSIPTSSSFDSELGNLIEQCLEIDNRKRATMHQLFKHVFLQKAGRNTHLADVLGQFYIDKALGGLFF
mmetsp:Transcript_45862/g.115496  ORF Transcript_45862/g.115496 Transcript_45862/m.115496 type:complete len:300 (+) Transcript_45862:431-1330(+)